MTDPHAPQTQPPDYQFGAQYPPPPQHAPEPYPAHSAPSIANIGAGLVAAGIPPHEVPVVVARLQRLVTGLVAEAVSLVVGHIEQAQAARMHQIGGLIQRLPTMGYAGGGRDALYALLSADPVSLDRALLAASYNPDDWQQQVRNNTAAGHAR